jgi:hypothetical protein
VKFCFVAAILQLAANSLQLADWAPPEHSFASFTHA